MSDVHPEENELEILDAYLAQLQAGERPIGRRCSAGIRNWPLRWIVWRLWKNWGRSQSWRIPTCRRIALTLTLSQRERGLCRLALSQRERGPGLAHAQRERGVCHGRLGVMN